MVVTGWHYFWCRTLDAQYTKLVGAGLLFGCLSSLLSLAFGSVDVAGKPFRAGGYLGEWLASSLADYLNRTGSIIVILTLLFLAIVLSTQFSLGRMFSSATQVSRSGGSRMFGALRSWLDERRRARQRQSAARQAGQETRERGAGPGHPETGRACANRRRPTLPQAVLRRLPSKTAALPSMGKRATAP